MDVRVSKGVTGRRRDFPNVSPRLFCGGKCGPLLGRYHDFVVIPSSGMFWFRLSHELTPWGFDYRTGWCGGSGGGHGTLWNPHLRGEMWGTRVGRSFIDVEVSRRVRGICGTHISEARCGAPVIFQEVASPIETPVMNSTFNSIDAPHPPRQTVSSTNP
jgi:hypothetical protein